MKKVLFLDDDSERRKWFKTAFGGRYDVTYAETVEEAVEALKTQNFDILSLDHDLGGEVYVPSGPGTGYEVAKFVSTLELSSLPFVVVHSYNSGGAFNMVEVLRQAGFSAKYYPFKLDAYKEFFVSNAR